MGLFFFFCCFYLVRSERTLQGGSAFVSCSGQQQERGQQAEGHPSPAEGGHRPGAVAQVCVAAHVGVVKVEAGGVFLAAHATLGGDGAALLIHAHLERSWGGEG